MGIRVCLKIQVLGFAADVVVVVAGVDEVASGVVDYVADEDVVAVGGGVVINDDESGTEAECAADDECAVVVIYRSFR